jgi:branched-subunit amino acid aminotransferase/4-amino-4-deoxychorismate lyase
LTLLALAVSGRGLVDPGRPAIHADDEGFVRGRAAFETIRVYGGRPFRLDRHLDRLEASVERLGIGAPARAELERLVEGALRQAGEPEAVLRLYCTPGREASSEPVALAMVATLPPELDETRARGLKLQTLDLGIEASWPLGGVKSTSYALNMIALDAARAAGDDDTLFLGRDGVVLEGTTANIWWRSGTTLFTPSLGLGVLAGVTRAVILESADGLGYEVREGAFALDDLLAADEAFLSSSVREVMPVVAVNGTPIGDGRPGQAAAQMQQALRRAATTGT